VGWRRRRTKRRWRKRVKCRLSFADTTPRGVGGGE
jgi:hypothetical protein